MTPVRNYEPNFHAPQKPVEYPKTVDIPVDLYESLNGRYFTGQSPTLLVTCRSNAWAALVNPVNSGVVLRINVATLNYIHGEPLTVGFYLNSELPGMPHEVDGIVPANTALKPLPQSRARLWVASDVRGRPEGGEFAFSRTAYPGQLLMLEKGGVFAVPPGGNYCVFIETLQRKQECSAVYVALGWWEEPIHPAC